MKLPFNEEAWDIGVGTCTLHHTVTVYAMFVSMNLKTKMVRVDVFCSKCYEIHKEKVPVTQKRVTLKVFADGMYFDDKTRDN